MTKLLNINGQRFALPDGMPAKDVQALAGFLAMLTPVESLYDYDASEYMHAPALVGAQLQIETVELADRAAAKSQSTASYERYQAKRAAEKLAKGEA